MAACAEVDKQDRLAAALLLLVLVLLLVLLLLVVLDAGRARTSVTATVHTLRSSSLWAIWDGDTREIHLYSLFSGSACERVRRAAAVSGKHVAAVGDSELLQHLY